ncbi:MAG: M14 family metallopeptidase [Betaproteobacteria bacterium]|nr:M14 family metallopeptidase [Betaproteobacteria bacterium]MDH3436724.1 M14 family metallopeptidase [Betaproteobacteria bacterium]
MLSILTDVPPGLLEAAPTELHRILAGPTLIHLPGQRREPVLISVLLHGNEDTGLRAAQTVLERHAQRPLPRALSLFIGNVAAARLGVRRLDGQPDYNRVWPGSDQPHAPEHEMMARVVEEMRGRHVFASVDIHNNSGLNPHYACVSRLDLRALQLCALFSRTVVHFERPLGVQVSAFNDLCPAVTLECGKSGSPGSAEHVADFIEACLRLSEFPAHAPHPQDLDLYHSVATVKVPSHVTFSFGEDNVDLQLAPELDHMNFRELTPHTFWGHVRAGCARPLEVTDAAGSSAFERYFAVSNSELRLARTAMPAMLTLDERAIRQDCLCYLMERLVCPPLA